MMSRLIHTYTVILFVAVLFSTSPASMAQGEDATQPGPIFLSAFKAVTEAEKLEEAKSYKESWEKYHQALRFYKTLSNTHPGWKAHLVNGRITSTEESIKRISPMAEEEYSLERDRLAHLVEGAPASSQSTPNHTAKIFTPTEQRELTGIKNDYQYYKKLLEAERLKHAEETRKLKDQIKDKEAQLKLGKDSPQVRMLNGEIARLQLEIRDIQANDKKTQAKYLETLDKLQRQRERLASAPLRKDVEKLREETERQNKELRILSQDYKKKVHELDQIRKEQAADKTQFALLQNKLERTEKQLDAAKDNANAVVRSLRDENQKLRAEVAEQNAKINEQNIRITDLTEQLTKSNAIAEELRLNLEKVTTERDQLTELLQLGDVERGKQLMKENIRLASELVKLKRDMEVLHDDKNVAQDRVIEAENNLAVAKQQILKLKDERIDYIKRISLLEATLKDTREQLNQKLSQPQLSDTDREEIEVLRSTVQRLMAAQTRRRKVEEALFAQYRKDAAKDENIKDLMDKLAANTITLTDEERKYLAEQDSTDTLVSPLKKYASGVQRNIAEQRREEQIKAYHDMAKGFIEKGKLASAIDTLDMAYDTTYDYNFLVNRGVIRLRLGNETGDKELYKEAARIFETGVTTRPNNPYTHFMLGMSRYYMQEDTLATKSLEKAIDLKPDDQMAYLYLGIIAAQNSQYSKAEESFDNAIRLNPEFHDAQYNMSVLHLMRGNMEAARRYYNDALRSGHPIVPEHESKLGIKKAG